MVCWCVTFPCVAILAQAYLPWAACVTHFFPHPPTPRNRPGLREALACLYVTLAITSRCFDVQQLSCQCGMRHSHTCVLLWLLTYVALMFQQLSRQSSTRHSHTCVLLWLLTFAALMFQQLPVRVAQGIRIPVYYSGCRHSLL